MGGGARTSLSVEDRGSGIVPEEMPLFYNQFFRPLAAHRMRPMGSDAPGAAAASDSVVFCTAGFA